jgi:catechol 2,3-dioxygenase-like lactoylglutathione lyase family enzyme
MPVLRLDHVNIRTAKLAETRDFFVSVVGLAEGPRPAFRFAGHWLYSGDDPVIHLSALRDGDEAQAPGARSAIDHISFRLTGIAEMRERLARLGVRYDERVVPTNGDHQLFVEDPNGVLVELTFPASDVAAAGVTPEDGRSEAEERRRPERVAGS